MLPSRTHTIREMETYCDSWPTEQAEGIIRISAAVVQSKDCKTKHTVQQVQNLFIVLASQSKQCIVFFYFGYLHEKGSHQNGKGKWTQAMLSLLLMRRHTLIHLVMNNI